MRLGQLSRKLSVRPGDIIEFLSKNSIQIDNDSNTRLDDEHVVLIMQHFAPGSLTEESIDAVQESDDLEKDLAEDLEVSSPSSLESTATLQQEQQEEIQDTVIKAPKIELSGLKILGKIDLPERKKKETLSDAGQPAGQDTTGAENQKRPDRRRSLRDDQGHKAHRKNTIALKREQEAVEAEKKRQERAQQQKEKRTQSYLRRVKTAAPTKSARLIEEPTEELSKIEDTPTTLLGRFFRWLKS